MARKAKVGHPSRGEVDLVNFDLTIGSEIRNSRPALVLQNDIANRHILITIAAEITSQFDEPLYPTEVLIPATEGELAKDSVVLLNKVRSIDKARLIKRLGRLRPATMQRVDNALQIRIGLVKI